MFGICFLQIGGRSAKSRGWTTTQRFAWQLRRPGHADGPASVVEPHAHEMRHEGITQRRKLGVRWLQSANGLICDDRASAPGGILAQGSVALCA